MCSGGDWSFARVHNLQEKSKNDTLHHKDGRRDEWREMKELKIKKGTCFVVYFNVTILNLQYDRKKLLVRLSFAFSKIRTQNQSHFCRKESQVLDH